MMKLLTAFLFLLVAGVGCDRQAQAQAPSGGWNDRAPAQRELSLADTVRATEDALRLFTRDYAEALYRSQITYRKNRYSVEITFSWNNDENARAKTYRCHSAQHGTAPATVHCH